MKRWIGVLVGVSFLALVGSGCSPTADRGPGGPAQISRDTPGHLLDFLAAAYGNKDGEEYDVALHDNFQFVFTSDVAEKIGLPPEQPWWTKDLDVGSTVRMFNSSAVTQIIMDYVNEGTWDPVEITRPDGTYSGVYARVEPDIRVTIVDPGTEPITYVVNESYLDVYAVRDPKYPDEVNWVFLEIQEHSKNE